MAQLPSRDIQDANGGRNLSNIEKTLSLRVTGLYAASMALPPLGGAPDRATMGQGLIGVDDEALIVNCNSHGRRRDGPATMSPMIHCRHPVSGAKVMLRTHSR